MKEGSPYLGYWARTKGEHITTALLPESVCVASLVWKGKTPPKYQDGTLSHLQSLFSWLCLPSHPQGAVLRPPVMPPRFPSWIHLLLPFSVNPNGTNSKCLHQVPVPKDQCPRYPPKDCREVLWIHTMKKTAKGPLHSTGSAQDWHSRTQVPSGAYVSFLSSRFSWGKAVYIPRCEDSSWLDYRPSCRWLSSAYIGNRGR